MNFPRLSFRNTSVEFQALARDKAHMASSYQEKQRKIHTAKPSKKYRQRLTKRK